jgi:hypothetical protein
MDVIPTGTGPAMFQRGLVPHGDTSRTMRRQLPLVGAAANNILCSCRIVTSVLDSAKAVVLIVGELLLLLLLLLEL